MEAEDAELVAACRAGDQRAWRQLVERHARLVNGILRGAYRLNPMDAEDAFQEVFTRLYLKLDTVRDDNAVVGWIAQVARNVAIDTIRRSGREQPMGDDIDAHEDAHDPVSEVLDALLIREAMSELPGPQREIIERFFVKDESYQTISQALGVPAGTIASRISRALAALRVEIDGRSVASPASH